MFLELAVIAGEATMKDDISTNLKIMGTRSKLVLIIVALMLLLLEFVFHRHAGRNRKTDFFLLYTRLLYVSPLFCVE